VATESARAFAIWITGLPGSGKSTLAKALTSELRERGVNVAVLESDTLRKVFTPEPTYEEFERIRFYSQMVYVGKILLDHGIQVIFDATANRRAWREEARRRIPRFLEVYVDTPLETCAARDPKGIYQRARQGEAHNVPGLQAEYEAPEKPEVIVAGERESPTDAAHRIVSKLAENGWLI
jgi:adenylylsulfate kinase